MQSGKINDFKQFGSIAGNVRSFMLAQKCRARISEFWPKFTLLRKQRIKFALSSEFQYVDDFQYK